MTLHKLFVVLTVLLLLPAALLPAQDAPPDPVIEPDVIEPTLKPAAASVSKAYERLLPAVVEVRISILEDKEPPSQEESLLDRQLDRFNYLRIPVRLSGVRIAEEGTVLIRDPNIPLRRYGVIEIVDAKGDIAEGRIEATLENYAGILLEPIDPPNDPLPFLEFARADLSRDAPLLVAQPAFLEDMLAVHLRETYPAATAIYGNEPDVEIGWWQEYSYSEALMPTTAPIVMSADAQPLGVVLDGALWHEKDGADSWIGTRIIADKRISRGNLERISNTIRARARASVKEVQIQFRSDSPLTRQLRLEEGRMFLYGVLLDAKGRLLVPSLLSAEAIRQIENIVVHDETSDIEAEFEGLYRDFGAFVIRAKDVSGTPNVVMDSASIERGKIFYTLSVSRRYGQRHDRIEYNRYLDTNLGYKNLRYLDPLKPMHTGDMIADAEGRLLGFHAPVLREKQDVIRTTLVGTTRHDTAQSRAFLFSEIADELRDPKGKFDITARPMSRKEEYGMVWLGVEFQGMSSALARAFNAEDATRGGARGLLITDVYEGSPAETMGLRTGDVLLSLIVPGATAEIDLSVPDGEDEPSRGRGPLWTSRRNRLTVILTLLGEGREISVRYLQDGNELVKPFVLEKAPDDFYTSDQYRDDTLGLTVRDVTYEIRRILRWPADMPGVVVSQVEPGSKAAVAQIRPFEIITRVNNQPVASPKEFERVMRSASVRGRVELLVVWLDQSRIVDLQVSAGPL